MRESEADYKELCDLLVQRGFIRAYTYNDKTKVACFDFTSAGEQLRLRLRQLLDVPAVRPMDLDADLIISLVMIVLLTPLPGQPV